MEPDQRTESKSEAEKSQTPVDGEKTQQFVKTEIMYNERQETNSQDGDSLICPGTDEERYEEHHHKKFSEPPLDDITLYQRIKKSFSRSKPGAEPVPAERVTKEKKSSSLQELRSTRKNIFF